MADILQPVWEFLGKNAAAVIALCALLFTAYEVFATRKHNRLTVRPHIASFAKREVNAQDGKTTITLCLVNHGLGPAVIKSYSVFLYGMLIDAGTPSEALKAMVKAFGDAKPTSFYIGNLTSDYMMRKDESFNYLVAEFSAPSLEKLEQLSDVNEVDARVERFKVVVRYASVYGDKFTFESSRT